MQRPVGDRAPRISQSTGRQRGGREAADFDRPLTRAASAGVRGLTRGVAALCIGRGELGTNADHSIPHAAHFRILPIREDARDWKGYCA